MQSEDDVAHLTELLWRCTRLPQIDKARVNDGMFQDSEFTRHHMRRSQARGISRDGCAEQGGHRSNRRLK